MLCVPATVGGAQTGGDPKRESDALAQRVDSALLDLYSLDSQLARARTKLASLREQRTRIAHERGVARVRVGLARHDLRASQTRLARLVHTLYEQEPADPIAVLLGAQSIEEAVTTLDDLARSADQHRDIAAQSRDARARLERLLRRIATADARARVLESAAAESERSLVATRAERGEYVAALVEQKRLADSRLEQVRRIARESATRTLAVAAPAAEVAPHVEPTTGGATGARTVTVVATGYSAAGTTAVGLPTGWGTVAVDPAVIPLGTRLTIPGYGEGVAADTGSAVRGATIDLWFPSPQQALNWGRRVVTVRLH
jgi:3D (Asp-Asp-Asp) domain-containing protein